MVRLTKIKKNYPKPIEKIIEPNYTSTNGKPRLDVIIAFDTTGSMGSYIREVRKQVYYLGEGLTQRLDTMITFAGIGDHCDGKDWMQIKKPSNDPKQLKRYINNIKNTDGGDEPEAYECLFKYLNEQTYEVPTVLVMVGDAFPHGTGYRSDRGCTKKVDYKVEVKQLHKNLAGFYFVNVGNDSYSRKIQRTMVKSSRYLVDLSRINVLTELVMGLALEEVGEFDKFYEDLKKDRGQNVADEVLHMIRR
ncbi:vWA domain-containing protein [Nanoarchaeota archaeon]